MAVVALGSLLEGDWVQLEPLEPRHREGLRKAAAHAEIWTWLAADLTHEEALDAWLREAWRAEAQGTEHPFAVLLKATGEVVGSTRYLDVRAPHRALEVGWTWYTPRVWGTAVNPEAKLLLLSHAFDRWGAIRVALKTDVMNSHSQAAIRKLGAKEEGVLRNDRLRRDGSLRHTVVFSVVRDEWPTVRRRLAERLDAFRSDPS